MEEYVHSLCNFTFGSRYQRLRVDPASKNLRADGVIWLPRGYIVVECKSKRPNEKRRFGNRTESELFEELHQSGLRLAVEQVQSTTREIVTGAIPSPRTWSFPVIGSFIVTFQKMPVSAVAADMLGSILPWTHDETYGKVLVPQVLTLGQLEELTRWRDVDWLAMIETKAAAGADAFDSVPDFIKVAMRWPQQASLHEELYADMRSHLSSHFSDGEFEGSEHGVPT